MSDSDVPIKDYVDALNAERRHAGDMRAVAIVGTFGALVFGIFRATSVLAKTFEKRMDTTNEWRGTLEDQSKNKASTQQFDQLKEQIEEVKARATTSTDKAAGGRDFATNMIQTIASVGTLLGIAYLVFGGAMP